MLDKHSTQGSMPGPTSTVFCQLGFYLLYFASRYSSHSIEHFNNHFMQSAFTSTHLSSVLSSRQFHVLSRFAFLLFKGHDFMLLL